MEKKKAKPLVIEPRAVFETENGWPEDDHGDPTTTLATVTFTHLKPSADSGSD